MDMQKRIERGLERAITFATASGNPAKISQAIRYSVFPGGARIRPRLCLAVAAASGDANPAAADAAATAIELLHCASLVHDDLPCFDDAELRRGETSCGHSRGHCDPPAQPGCASCPLSDQGTPPS